MLNCSFFLAPKGLSGGAIAGIVVGSVAALILIVALILLLARRGSRSSKQECTISNHHININHTSNNGSVSSNTKKTHKNREKPQDVI